MHVAFLGLGLIGGSIARALRARDSAPTSAPTVVTAWTPRGDGPRAALAAGAIDEVAADPAAAVAGADLIVVAAPPMATLDLIDVLASLPDGVVGPAATVTDVASTKGAIVRRAH